MHCNICSTGKRAVALRLGLVEPELLFEIVEADRLKVLEAPDRDPTPAVQRNVEEGHVWTSVFRVKLFDLGNHVWNGQGVGSKNTVQ